MIGFYRMAYACLAVALFALVSIPLGGCAAKQDTWGRDIYETDATVEANVLHRSAYGSGFVDY